MDWTCVYGQDVYLNSELLGYVGRTDEGIGILYLGKKEFCEIDENGKFWIGSTQIGYIDDGGDIHMKGHVVGEVDSRNAIRFKSL